MLRITLCLLVGVSVWEFASCSITCPDGNICSDFETCCETVHGYKCCPYPRAVCCPDKAHCCPSGFRCNLVTQMCEKEYQPWMNVPMVKKEPADKPQPLSPLQSAPQELDNNHIPDQQKSSVIHCDNYWACPDGTTCCKYAYGTWYCCPYSPGRCCRDGVHCCPWGTDCDPTFTRCVRQGLTYPLKAKQALSSVPASRTSTSEDKGSLEEKPLTALTEASGGNREAGVIRCDSSFFCPKGSTCCNRADGQWNCCPYPLGQCCADGQHCCQYGYNCDPTFTSCRKWYSEIPAGTQKRAIAV